MGILIFLFVYTTLLFRVMQRKMEQFSKPLCWIYSFLLGNFLLAYTQTLAVLCTLPFEQLVYCSDTLGIIGLAYTYRSKQFAQHTTITTHDYPFFNILLYCIAGYFVVAFLKVSNTWGDWDAYGIWTLHAKFLFFPESFVQMMAPSLRYAHPDYPLMLPSLIAAYWHLTGGVNSEAPMLIALAVCILIIVVVYADTSQKKLPLLGLLFAYWATRPDYLLPIGASQYADTLLALLILCSFILLSFAETQKNRLAFLILGFVVGSSGWVKNEGLFYAVIFSLCLIVRLFRQPKTWAYYGLGMMFPIAIILFYKSHYNLGSDLFVQEISEILQKLKDPARAKIIRDQIHNIITTRHAYVYYLLLALLILRIRYFTSFYFWVLAFQLIAYLCIYQITPHDLHWHLSTSSDRLLHHLLPALLYSALLFVGQKSTNGYFFRVFKAKTS